MKRSFIVTGIMMAFLVSCVFIGVAHAQEVKVIQLRMADFNPSTTLLGQTLQAWATEVGKRTNGRVKVTVYPAGTLAPATQIYDGVTKEVADVGHGIFSYIKGRFPMMEAIDLPLGYNNAAIPTKLITAYAKKFNPKELQDVKVLFLHAHGPGALASKKAVTKLEQLKGMKIRAHNVSARIVTALGGAAVGLPITETYDALSKGVVDGVMNEKGGVYNWKLGEVVSYVLECPALAYSTAFYTVMNKDKWNSLPKDIQVIIDQVSQEWVDRMAKMWVEWDNMGKSQLEKKGIKFLTLPPAESARWSEKTKPVIGEWIKGAKAKGLPGDEAVKFCQEFLKANQK